MVYGIYLVLGQKSWFYGDYSSSNKLTGTIYSDKELATAFNLTGYTIMIRFYKRFGFDDYFNKTGSIVSASSGTWDYAVQQNDVPSSGLYLVKVELSKSGEILSTLNDVELFVKEGPSA